MPLFFILFSLFFFNINAEKNAEIKYDEIIFQTIKQNNTSGLKSIIKKNPNLVAYKDKHQNNLMHIATMYDSQDIIKYLLTLNKNFDTANIGGVTPMHLVATRCNKRIIQLLYEKKFDINAADITGYSPFLRMIAARCNPSVITPLIADANLKLRDNNGQDLKTIINNLPEKVKNSYMQIAEIKQLFKDE
jgi:ankyrin repeat protein